MAYNILIADEKTWAKDLSKIPQEQITKIFDRLEKLEAEPWPKEIQIKQLKNYPTADFRLRIGSYRVLLDRDLYKKEIHLYRILHRSKLY